MDLNALEKLAELREKGILTEEEFLKEKSKLIDNSPTNFNTQQATQFSTNNNTFQPNKNIKVPKGMKKCKTCGQLISKKANICPHCGRDDRPAGQKNPGIGCLAIILIIVGGWLFCDGIFDSIVPDISKTIEDTQTAIQNERFDISETTTSTDGITYYIEGTITNKTNSKMSYVQVIFNLYDENGIQVGTAMDNINNLEANGKWKFKAMSLDFDGQAKSYKLSEITGF